VKLFTDIVAARFKSRPNRFIVECLLGGGTVRAYLPNPGRLWELFFPGTMLSLIKFPRSSGRKLAYMVVAVDREGMPVMLHTHYNNLVARKRNDRRLAGPRVRLIGLFLRHPPLRHG
jgi:sugar fermentation stimulation protein A